MTSNPLRHCLLGIALTLSGQPILAADFTLDLPIDAVTVYPAGAEVTRAGQLQLPAGNHRLILAGLPDRLDPARLSLLLDSPSVRLGNLQIEARHQGDLTNAAEQRLQQELEALQDERQAVVDDIEAANTQLRLLEAVVTGGGGDEPITGAELNALLGAVAAASQQARDGIREANRSLRGLDRDIQQKQFELDQVATRRQVVNQVTVSIEVNSDVTTPVQLRYPVAQARWSWLYEARLDTEERQLALLRRASVQQTTGEDWSDVELTITTARNNENTETPRLGSLLVDILRPMPLAVEERALRAPAAELMAGATTSYANEFDQQFVDVSASQYLVEYRVPGRVTVAADSQPQVLPVDQRAVAVDLIVRAVPERDLAAYLEARFTLEDTVPLQAGMMQLYRDGAFIGRRAVPEYLPNEDVRLAFGRDDRVRVETRPVEEASRDGGLLRRNAVDDRRVRYLVTSYHAEPIAVEVLARLPVAQNNAIQVEVIDGATPFTEQDVDGNPGVVLWRLDARPTQTTTINHFYRILYPQDDQLWFIEN
ncbi:MAG: hypothetical protein RLZZ385_2207 [Pseudomonadota bacterium]